MASLNSKTEQVVGGLRCASVSDVGMRRSSNQDSLAISLADSPQLWQSHGHLFVVADGMGAHAAGELASQMATDNIPLSYHKIRDLLPSEAIVEAVRHANGVIHKKGQDSVDFHGMGTTCSCLLLLPCGAIAAHVGDSRVYRLRGKFFEQLTFDHSLVWEMAAAGHAKEEDVPPYVPKNVITRSLGPHPTVAVDVEGPFKLQTGDRFLLCSDGLTGPLTPELIGMVLGALPLDEAAQTLADLANLLGGPDNITTIVAEVVNVEKLGEAFAKDETPANASRASKISQKPRSLGAMAVILGLVFTSVLLAIEDLPLAAVISLGGALAMAVVMLARHFSSPKTDVLLELGLQGKAPYRRHACAINASSIEPLADIVRQLEDLEGQQDWQIDWETIHEDRNQAYQAIARADFHSAVVSYCSAVRRLMSALRETRGKGTSDSTVDLDDE